MKKLSLLLLSLSLIGLTGCTVTSYRQADTTPVPAERLYGHQEPLAEEALVRITRLSNYGGSACYFTVLIDDERAARFDTEEQAMFHLAPGEHKFQVAGDWDGRGLCSASEEWVRDHGQIREVDLKAGRVYDFRIGFNSWGGVFRLYVDKIGKPVESEN